MQQNRSAGFTLIELMVVIFIIGLLAATFLPDLLANKLAAQKAADVGQMGQHNQWLTMYQTKFKGSPREGGHKFLISFWTGGVATKSSATLEKFFTPGLRDNDDHFHMLRDMDVTEVWRDLAATTSADTHYAARRKDKLSSMRGGTEAVMANDNEGQWAFEDGTVNVMYAGGNVESLTFELDLQKKYGWPDLTTVMPTFGDASPVPALKNLDK